MSTSKSNRCPAPLCAAPLPPNGGMASQHALLKIHLPLCADPQELLTRLHPVEDALGLPHSALPQTEKKSGAVKAFENIPGEPTKAVQKWADTAMFTSVPLDARTGPEVQVLSLSADPLGEIASAVLMYQGKPVKALSEITREERIKAFEQVQATKLKAPFEFVKLHVLFSNVTRSWTHQLVRQRTAAYAQESLRFAVVEDGFSTRVALPPSLMGTEGGHVEHSGPEYDRLSQREKWRIKWDRALYEVESTYAELIADGMPAEDARGLLPHNITTRVHYTTDLRALQDHAGNRLCTQAQFEWRGVFIALVKAIREYNPYAHAIAAAKNLGDQHAVDYLLHLHESERWQFEKLAELFRPVCYLTGKCEFAAQDLDRKCSIRDRVDANHAAGRSSSFWHTHGNGNLKPIDPMEWLGDPGAAR